MQKCLKGKLLPGGLRARRRVGEGLWGSEKEGRWGLDGRNAAISKPAAGVTPFRRARWL